MRSVRRLVILHLALGIAAVIIYWQRPDAFLAHSHVRARETALFTVIKVFLAWIPYFISAFYSTSVLPERDPRATTAFMGVAVAAAIVAACLNLNVFNLSRSPAAWLVFAGLTLVLLGAARLCAAVWRRDSSGWGTPS